MVKLNAHFDGKIIIPDEPNALPFKSGTRLQLSVEAIEEPRIPSPAEFKPLDIKIDPALSQAIAEDRELRDQE